MHPIRHHLTYANVMATIAVFLVLSGGTAVALSGSNTVFSDDIADNQVYSADVRDDTLNGGGLSAADLRPGSVGSSEVGADSLMAADLAGGSVETSEVAADSLTAADLAAGSVGSSEVAADALTAGDLAAGSVGSSEVANNSLTGSDIVEASLGGVGSANFAADASLLDGSDSSEFLSTTSGGTVNGPLTMNTTTGADLELGESTLFRSSPTDETFTMSNPGAGDLNLSVEGQVTASGFITLATITGSAPASTACDDAREAGRAIIRTDGATNLYLCRGRAGWIRK